MYVKVSCTITASPTPQKSSLIKRLYLNLFNTDTSPSSQETAAFMGEDLYFTPNGCNFMLPEKRHINSRDQGAEPDLLK